MKEFQSRFRVTTNLEDDTDTRQTKPSSRPLLTGRTFSPSTVGEGQWLNWESFLEETYGPGYKLVKSQGWQIGDGLGPEKQGVITPLESTTGQLPLPLQYSSRKTQGTAAGELPHPSLSLSLLQPRKETRNIFRQEDVWQFINSVSHEEFQDMTFLELTERMEQYFSDVTVLSSLDQFDGIILEEQKYYLLLFPESRHSLASMTHAVGFPTPPARIDDNDMAIVHDLIASMVQSSLRGASRQKFLRLKLLFLLNYPSVAIKGNICHIRYPRGTFVNNVKKDFTQKYSWARGVRNENGWTWRWVNLTFTTKLQFLERVTHFRCDSRSGKTGEDRFKGEDEIYQLHPGGSFQLLENMYLSRE